MTKPGNWGNWAIIEKPKKQKCNNISCRMCNSFSTESNRCYKEEFKDIKTSWRTCRYFYFKPIYNTMDNWNELQKKRKNGTIPKNNQQNNRDIKEAKKRQAKLKKKEREYASIFPDGTRVLHHSFGLGSVTKQVFDGKITVMFDIAGEKTLGIDVCMQKGLLQKISDEV